MAGFHSISWPLLLFSAILVLITALMNFPLSKKISLSFLTLNLRAFLQLLSIGFVLQLLFQKPLLNYSALYLVFMSLAAFYTAKGKVEASLRWRCLLLFSLVFGSFLALIFSLFFILKINLLFHPQYTIPLYGMLLANTLNALTLFFDSAFKEIETEKETWQTLLFLTSSPFHTFSPILLKSYARALLPLFNYLSVVGIVQLPGLMTGQIIAGILPLEAIKYQILISFLLTFAVASSLLVALFFFPFLYFQRHKLS